MLRRIAIIFVPSLTSALLAGWLSGRWGNLDAYSRLATACIVGVLVLTLLLVLKRDEEKGPLILAIGSRIRAKGAIRVKHVKAPVGGQGQANVGVDLTSEKGDVDISDIEVNERSTGDEGNPN